MSKIMTFHSSPMATRICVCRVINGIGFDAFDNKYRAVVDDYGYIVFVS